MSWLSILQVFSVVVVVVVVNVIVILGEGGMVLSFGFNLFCFNLFHVFDVIKYATVFKVFNLFIVI